MDDIIRSNDKAPHVATIHIQAQVCEQLPTGEITGRPVHKQEVVLAIKGQDRFIAQRKLNELIEELKIRCQ
jgi:hypothetical protein